MLYFLEYTLQKSLIKTIQNEIIFQNLIIFNLW